MSSSSFPTEEEMAARRKAEEDAKKAREAEWTAQHPLWFNALQRDDIGAVYAQVHAPGFDVEQRYKVYTEATPLGWAVLADRGAMAAMLIEAGASPDAEIKFWGNQTWTVRDYAVRYCCENSLKAIATAKKMDKRVGEDVD